MTSLSEQESLQLVRVIRQFKSIFKKNSICSLSSSIHSPSLLLWLVWTKLFLPLNHPADLGRLDETTAQVSATLGLWHPRHPGRKTVEQQRVLSRRGQEQLHAGGSLPGLLHQRLVNICAWRPNGTFSGKIAAYQILIRGFRELWIRDIFTCGHWQRWISAWNGLNPTYQLSSCHHGT